MNDRRRTIIRELAADLTDEDLAQPDRIIATRSGNTPPPSDGAPPGTGGYLPGGGVHATLQPGEFVLGRDMFT